MKEFLIARGWYCAGACNCTPKMDKYHHADKPGWEYRINHVYYKLYFMGNQRSQSAPESFENVYQKTFG
jgi:hypothetical protein